MSDFTFVTRKPKAPNVQRTYEFDWSAWSEGQEITSHSVTTQDDAITLSGISLVDKVVRVSVSGGSDNTDYYVTCKVERADGDGDEATLRIPVRAR